MPIEKLRVIDIVLLFCRFCDQRVGAVNHEDFRKIQKEGIVIYCEPCRRRVEEEEHETKHW